MTRRKVTALSRSLDRTGRAREERTQLTCANGPQWGTPRSPLWANAGKNSTFTKACSNGTALTACHGSPDGPQQ